MSDLEPRVALLLSLADDELIIGHRLSEWTGWVPYIEEDLAMSSIAQDEMGHARAFYELVSTISQTTVDDLALGRPPDQYRNAVLCERTNRDFAFTLARHWLYDHADDVRLEALDASSFKELREIVPTIRLEERYHLQHADAWFARLADGPVDARRRFADALADGLVEALALFEPIPGEESLVADGTMPSSSEELLGRWLARVGDRLEQAGLEHVLGARPGDDAGEMIPTSSGSIESSERHAEPLTGPGLVRRDGRWVHEGGFEGAGGRHGLHSEEFMPLWSEMTALYRAHPGATW